MNPAILRPFQNATRSVPSKSQTTNLLNSTNKPRSPLPTSQSPPLTSSSFASNVATPTIVNYQPLNNYLMVPYVGVLNREFVQFYPAYSLYQPIASYSSPSYPSPLSYSTSPFYSNNTYSQASSSTSSFASFKPNNKTPKRYFGNSARMNDNAEATEKEGLLNAEMNFEELREGILQSFRLKKNCKLSWLHRMLTKVENESDYEKCMVIWNQYIIHNVETTPETGTLIIKASCKAGIPERGLSILHQFKGKPHWPSMAGIQYLMINLSLNKNTDAVMQLYELIKSQNMKMTPKTFHIVIRECVDNDLIKEALLFAAEAKEMGVEMNRVAYNILMNGCRKHNMANEIIKLRSEMEQHQVDINDTTVKFTSLAHMMLGQTEQAVSSFLQFKLLKNVTLEDFCRKFLESPEVEGQQSHVTDLFQALKKEGVEVPAL